MSHLYDLNLGFVLYDAFLMHHSISSLSETEASRSNHTLLNFEPSTSEIWRHYSSGRVNMLMVDPVWWQISLWMTILVNHKHHIQMATCFRVAYQGGKSPPPMFRRCSGHRRVQLAQQVHSSFSCRMTSMDVILGNIHIK